MGASTIKARFASTRFAHLVNGNADSPLREFRGACLKSLKRRGPSARKLPYGAELLRCEREIRSARLGPNPPVPIRLYDGKAGVSYSLGGLRNFGLGFGRCEVWRTEWRLTR